MKYIKKIMILVLLLIVSPLISSAATYSTTELDVCANEHWSGQCNPTDTGSVNVPTSGDYDLSITIRRDNCQHKESFKFYVNGNYGGSSYDPYTVCDAAKTKTVKTENFGIFNLHVGNNTIRMVHLNQAPGDAESIHATFHFTKIEAPKPAANVTTYSATGVGEHSATLRGIVTDGDNVSTWFSLSTSPSVTCSNGTKYNTGTKNKGNSFSKSLTGLNDNTKYYYRACGVNTQGSDTGNLMSFTTDKTEEEEHLAINTYSATNIDEDSAKIRGKVLNQDNTEVWFAFSKTDSTPSCSSSSQKEEVSGRYDDGEYFTKTITDLEEDTRYYYRACGRGSIVSGEIKSFRTTPVQEKNEGVSTKSASNIGDTSAKLRGEVTGGDDLEVWFALAKDTDQTPSCSSSSQRVNISGSYDENDDFFKTVTNLEKNTEYNYRACTEDEEGEIIKGSIKSFKTDGDSGSDGDVETKTPRVNKTSATLKGKVTGGDNRPVWFAFSKTDSTPSCSSSSQKEEVSGKYDDGEYFSLEMTNLRENRNYYYRACTEDEEGNVISGRVIKFKTDKDVIKTKLVVTNTVSALTTNSARLHSIHVNKVGNVVSNFEYGRTTALGLSTPTVVNNGSTFSQTVYGLSPNTRYYYRAVMVDEGITYKGLVKSFVTRRKTIDPKPRPKPKKPEEKIVVVIKNINNLSLDKQVSQEKSFGYGMEIEAKPGDVVYYKVRVRNDTEDTVRDVDVVDHIPFYLELDSEKQTDDNSDKYLTWKINKLRPGESRVFITEMRVMESTPDGTTILSHATIESEKEEVSTNDVVITVNEFENINDRENNRQAASILGAGSTFFPQTIFGWLLLIAVILLIAYLIYKVLGERNETKLRLAALRKAEEDRYNG